MVGTKQAEKTAIRNYNQRERLEQLETRVSKQEALAEKLARALEQSHTSLSVVDDRVVARSNEIGYVLGLINRAINKPWFWQRYKARKELKQLCGVSEAEAMPDSMKEEGDPDDPQATIKPDRRGEPTDG